MKTRTLTIMLALAVGQLGLTGCEETNFEATTVAPPTRTAELDDANNRITLSMGVALGFECTYGLNNGGDSSCGEGTIASNDESIAGAFVGYAEELFEVVWYSDPSGDPITRFVVIGYQPGTTTVDIHTDCGDEQWRVTVLDDE